MGKNKQSHQQQQHPKRRQSGGDDSDWEAALKEAKATATHHILLTGYNST